MYADERKEALQRRMALEQKELEAERDRLFNEGRGWRPRRERSEEEQRAFERLWGRRNLLAAGVVFLAASIWSVWYHKPWDAAFHGVLAIILLNSARLAYDSEP